MDGETSKQLEMIDDHHYERRGFVRYILCGSLFINCFLLYAMRLNLSVSITAMVNSAVPENETFWNDSCRDPELDKKNNATVTSGTGEFDWDSGQQAMITYAFFIGYLFSQVPGGYMAQNYSLTWVLGLGMGFTSILTCLTAVTARTNFVALLALRAFEGLCEGVMFPSVFVFVSRWVPVHEQGFLLSFILAGANLGSVFTMPISALLCTSSWGWPASFYVFGIIGVLFTVLWLLYAADSPEHHRWISTAESNYIIQNRPSANNKRPGSLPWKQMLLSSAVWLLLLERLGATLNYFMILTELPNYLSKVFGIDIVKNGVITGSMIMGLTISLVSCGWIADRILEKELASKNFVRKFCVAVTCLVPSLCMAVIPLVGCDDRLVLALIFLNCLCMGFSGGGDSLLSLDIAPKYAGTLQGAVGCVGALAGVLAPLVVGLATKNNNTLSQWNLVFYCISAVGGMGATLFLIFGSTEEQKWSKDGHKEDEASVCEQ